MAALVSCCVLLLVAVSCATSQWSKPMPSADRRISTLSEDWVPVASACPSCPKESDSQASARQESIFQPPPAYQPVAQSTYIQQTLGAQQREIQNHFGAQGLLQSFLQQKPPAQQQLYQGHVRHQQPLQSALSHQQPLQSALSHQRPLQSDVSHQQPLQSALSHQQPLQSPLSHQQPLQSAVSHQRPLQSDVSHQQPLQSAVSHQRPLQSDVSHQQPLQSAVSHQRPLQSDVSHQQPLQSAVSHQRPLQSDVGHQQSQQPSTAQQYNLPVPQRPRRPSPSSSTTATPQEEVQLLYVPVETLRQQHQAALVRQQQQLTQQLQNLKPSATTERPAPSTTPEPYQPPLSVYMGPQEGHNVKLTDVVKVLKDSKSISVLDTVGPDSPQVFVGPSNLLAPEGYTKFELPYLSALDSNRIERKVDKPPFFVAPLSFKPPVGYSKIPFPAPHVGSVVVSNVTELLHEKGYSLPAELPPINPELPSLVNSLQDQRNVLLVPQQQGVTKFLQAVQQVGVETTTEQVRNKPKHGRKQSRNRFQYQEPVYSTTIQPQQVEASTIQPQYEEEFRVPSRLKQFSIAQEEPKQRPAATLEDDDSTRQTQYYVSSTRAPVQSQYSILQEDVQYPKYTVTEPVTLRSQSIPVRHSPVTARPSQQFPVLQPVFPDEEAKFSTVQENIPLRQTVTPKYIQSQDEAPVRQQQFFQHQFPTTPTKYAITHDDVLLRQEQFPANQEDTLLGQRFQSTVRPSKLDQDDTLLRQTFQSTVRPTLLHQDDTLLRQTYQSTIRPSQLDQDDTLLRQTFQSTVRPSQLDQDDTLLRQNFQSTARPSKLVQDDTLLRQSFQSTVRPSKFDQDDTQLRQNFQSTVRPSKLDQDIPHRQTHQSTASPSKYDVSQEDVSLRQTYQSSPRPSKYDSQEDVSLRQTYQSSARPTKYDNNQDDDSLRQTYQSSARPSKHDNDFLLHQTHQTTARPSKYDTSVEDVTLRQSARPSKYDSSLEDASLRQTPRPSKYDVSLEDVPIRQTYHSTRPTKYDSSVEDVTLRQTARPSKYDASVEDVTLRQNYQSTARPQEDVLLRQSQDRVPHQENTPVYHAKYQEYETAEQATEPIITTSTTTTPAPVRTTQSRRNRGRYRHNSQSTTTSAPRTRASYTRGRRPVTRTTSETPSAEASFESGRQTTESHGFDTPRAPRTRTRGRTRSTTTQSPQDVYQDEEYVPQTSTQHSRTDTVTENFLAQSGQVTQTQLPNRHVLDDQISYSGLVSQSRYHVSDAHPQPAEESGQSVIPSEQSQLPYSQSQQPQITDAQFGQFLSGQLSESQIPSGRIEQLDQSQIPVEEIGQSHITKGQQDTYSQVAPGQAHYLSDDVYYSQRPTALDAQFPSGQADYNRHNQIPAGQQDYFDPTSTEAILEGFLQQELPEPTQRAKPQRVRGDSQIVTSGGTDVTQKPTFVRIRGRIRGGSARVPQDTGEHLTTVSPELQTTLAVRKHTNFLNRGSARKTQAPVTTPTVETTTPADDKVYTVRPARRPQPAQTKLTTKGRIRRPTRPTTTTPTPTTLSDHRLNEVHDVYTTELPIPTTPRYQYDPIQQYQPKRQQYQSIQRHQQEEYEPVHQYYPDQRQYQSVEHYRIADQTSLPSDNRPVYADDPEKGAESQWSTRTVLFNAIPNVEKSTTAQPEVTTVTTELPSTTEEDDVATEPISTTTTTTEATPLLTVPPDVTSTTVTTNKPGHGRRKGNWVRVRVRPQSPLQPQDILETAESQNVATVAAANQIPGESTVKVTKTPSIFINSPGFQGGPMSEYDVTEKPQEDLTTQKYDKTRDLLTEADVPPKNEPSFWTTAEDDDVVTTTPADDITTTTPAENQDSYIGSLLSSLGYTDKSWGGYGDWWGKTYANHRPYYSEEKLNLPVETKKQLPPPGSTSIWDMEGFKEYEEATGPSKPSNSSLDDYPSYQVWEDLEEEQYRDSKHSVKKANPLSTDQQQQVTMQAYNTTVETPAETTTTTATTTPTTVVTTEASSTTTVSSTTELVTSTTTEESPSTTEPTTTSTQPSEPNIKRTDTASLMARILGTTTSTKISHETEICYRGRCIKTKTKDSDIDQLSTD